MFQQCVSKYIRWMDGWGLMDHSKIKWIQCYKNGPLFFKIFLEQQEGEYMMKKNVHFWVNYPFFKRNHLKTNDCKNQN